MKPVEKKCFLFLQVEKIQYICLRKIRWLAGPTFGKKALGKANKTYRFLIPLSQ